MTGHVHLDWCLIEFVCTEVKVLMKVLIKLTAQMLDNQWQSQYCKNSGTAPQCMLISFMHLGLT